MWLPLPYCHRDSLSCSVSGRFGISQAFIQCSVFKLVSSICVKYLYFLRIYIYSAKRLDYQCSIFVLSCAVTYDFLIKQVDEHTYVILPVSCSYIRQVTDYYVVLWLVGKFPIYFVFLFGFITFVYVLLVLR